MIEKVKQLNGMLDRVLNQSSGQSSLFDIVEPIPTVNKVLNEANKNLILENADLVNKHLSRWIKHQKEINGGFDQDVIDYINGLRVNFEIGKHPIKLTYARKRLIAARHREGNTIDQFKGMLSYMFQKWASTDFEKFLVPETLFRPSKFQKYLEEARENHGNHRTEDQTKSAYK